MSSAQQLSLHTGPDGLTHPVFAMRQTIIANLHCQVSREQAIPQGQVTAGWKAMSAQCASLGEPRWDGWAPRHSQADRQEGISEGPPACAQVLAPHPALAILEDLCGLQCTSMHVKIRQKMLKDTLPPQQSTI